MFCQSRCISLYLKFTTPSRAFYKNFIFYLLLPDLWSKACSEVEHCIGAIVPTVFFPAVTTTLFILSSPGHGVTLAERFELFLHEKNAPILNTTIALRHFNVFNDLYILILPISGVMGLNLRPKR